jgi:hypothetical protein
MAEVLNVVGKNPNTYFGSMDFFCFFAGEFLTASDGSTSGPLASSRVLFAEVLMVC